MRGDYYFVARIVERILAILGIVLASKRAAIAWNLPSEIGLAASLLLTVFVSTGALVRDWTPETEEE